MQQTNTLQSELITINKELKSIKEMVENINNQLIIIKEMKKSEIGVSKNILKNMEVQNQYV